MYDENSTLQVRLMMDEASKRLRDASVLSSTSLTYSDSAYLLELIAFELLLKATLRVHGVTPGRTHSYRRLFNRLPDDARRRILDVAADRMTTGADYSDLDTLLETWSRNFVDLRYPYEKYKGMAEDEYRARGAAWLARGAPDAEADFVYHPSELHGIVFALEREVRAWLECARQ